MHQNQLLSRNSKEKERLYWLLHLYSDQFP